ncbi:Hypothetical protein I595_3641 [Croceitalea dokdonensis DOKDO 023]|uniref:Uncharacterized protein n=1 Tax=Croceitalea dokdonensis DOKDO 023 TaxID=1300341 RepID=A0A0P7AAY3_9FLAO|nr:Hypothetical protein I595_3641 [Croceitalea dokdonensis DOKDO 023]
MVPHRIAATANEFFGDRFFTLNCNSALDLVVVEKPFSCLR